MSSVRSFDFCRRYWPLIRVNTSPCTMAALLPRGQIKSKWRSKPTHEPDTFPSMSGWSQTNRRGRSASPRLGCSPAGRGRCRAILKRLESLADATGLEEPPSRRDDQGLARDQVHARLLIRARLGLGEAVQIDGTGAELVRAGHQTFQARSPGDRTEEQSSAEEILSTKPHTRGHPLSGTKETWTSPFAPLIWSGLLAGLIATGVDAYQAYTAKYPRASLGEGDGSS